MLTTLQGFALQVASTPDAHLTSTIQYSHTHMFTLLWAKYSVLIYVAGRAVLSKEQQSLLLRRGTLHGAAGQDAVRDPEAQPCRHPRVTHSHHQVPGAVVPGADCGGAQPGVIPWRCGQGACVMMSHWKSCVRKLLKGPQTGACHPLQERQRSLPPLHPHHQLHGTLGMVSHEPGLSTFAGEAHAERGN